MSAKKLSAATILAGLLAATPALADKGGKGKGHGNPHDDGYKNDKHGNSGSSVEIRFGSDDRRIVSDYYGNAVRGGHCPPGLAKKNNGCMPPGQAKKWSVGRPLPGDVRYYPLPHDLEMRLRPAPAGYRYVQVAGDVLMIAVGTAMVVDAMQDLMR
jgi:Ni/Co efflux regulator RcnB